MERAEQWTAQSGFNNSVVCYPDLPTCIRWTAWMNENDPDHTVRNKEHMGLSLQKQLQDHCPVGRVDKIYRDTVICIEEFQAKYGRQVPPMYRQENRDGVCAHIQKLPRNLERDTPSLKKVLLQVGDSLQCIHDRHVAQGDIKAENVMIAEDGNPKLMDFGLAQSIRPDIPQLIINDWWQFLIMCVTLNGHLDAFEDTYSEKLAAPTEQEFNELHSAVPPLIWETPLLASLRGIVVQGMPVDWSRWWGDQIRPQLERGPDAKRQ